MKIRHLATAAAVAVLVVFVPAQPSHAAPCPQTIGSCLPSPIPRQHPHLPSSSLPKLHGIPLCIATSWARHHYHVRSTAPGTTCFVRMRVDPMGDVVSQADPSLSYSAKWHPRSWATLGWEFDKAGAPIAQFEQVS